MPTTSPVAVSAGAPATEAMPKSMSFARRPCVPNGRTIAFCGFTIAVDDAALMSVRQRVAEILADLGDVAVRDCTLARDAVQRLSLDELGDQEGVAVALAQLIERDDRGMVQAGGSLRLAEDALRAGGLDLLDRDVALKALVESPKNGAHAAGADSLLDPEPPHNEFA